MTKVQICAGAGIALVLPEGAQSSKEALHKVRYPKPTARKTEVGIANNERQEAEALRLAREWAEYQGFEVEEIIAAPW